MFSRWSAIALVSTLFLSILAGTLLTDLATANFFAETTPAGIQIQGDGSVTGTSLIQRNGNVYTLTGNIYQTIVVERDGIVLDGAGYMLQGNRNISGVFLRERNNVTIKNMIISNCQYGIKFTWMNYDMPATQRRNTVSGNTFSNNTYGIAIYDFSESNSFSENIIANNTYGILITVSSNNILRNNLFSNNTYSISDTSQQAHDIDTSNTIDGKPIYYWVNQHDKTVPLDAGFVALVNCNHITVQGLTQSHNSPGILLCNTTNSMITNNTLVNNANGISFRRSSNNTVSGNYMKNNDGCGISLDIDSDGNTISDNSIVENQNYGIGVSYSKGNHITRNHIVSNQDNGIDLWNAQNTDITGNNVTSNNGAGVKIGLDVMANTISGNYLTQNEVGMQLDFADPHENTGNTIMENMIIKNRGFGIKLDPSQTNNVFYRNNFIHNNVSDMLQVSNPGQWTMKGWLPGNPNSWDNGNQGNYWSDYLTRYTNASEVGSSGIGDTPFVINENNVDHYPLLAPYQSPQSSALPLLAMPKEYLNYTISAINGTLWAKIDGTYPMHLAGGSVEPLPMLYPTPPGTTNIHVTLDGTELVWSNYSKVDSTALHHTDIGDWQMIFCVVNPASEDFLLQIHYEHPVQVINGTYTFLYDLNISPYLSPSSPKSTAHFSIRLEVNCSGVNVYRTGFNGTWSPINFTSTKDGATETVTFDIVSEYDKPLAGDIVVALLNAEVPEFPTWVAAALFATVAVAAGLFFRKKRA